MPQDSEILEFHDDPHKWRMIGLVLIAVALASIIVFWILGERLIGDSPALTVCRIIVMVFALIAGVFGFALARLPVRDLAFDSVYKTLNLREKYIFSTKSSDIRFREIKDVFVEINELENSSNLHCFLELRDGERVEIPIGDADADAVCREVAKFIGLGK